MTSAPMRTASLPVLLSLAVLAQACAHSPLSGAELAGVTAPAFISRIELEAGPKSLVFREDSAYGDKLKKLDPKEADRRLQAKLKASITRFEVAERLRATTYALLPQEKPWTQTLEQTQVAFALQSFLVEEVPANAPDYMLLEPLGGDAVVEFVIEDFGMRSDDGHAGAYVVGYARMFRLEGGELYRRSFRSDAVSAGLPHLDPFRVGKEPERFRNALVELLDAMAVQFAKDLQPPDKVQPRPPAPEAPADEKPTPATDRTDGQPPAKFEAPRELPPGELPDPDA